MVAGQWARSLDLSRLESTGAVFSPECRGACVTQTKLTRSYQLRYIPEPVTQGARSGRYFTFISMMEFMKVEVWLQLFSCTLPLQPPHIFDIYQLKE